LAQSLADVENRFQQTEAVTIPYITLASDRALDIARANRLDWMNNRAALVDQWRLIAFNANALKAGLDVFFTGDLGTVGNNSVAFNGQNGSMRVGMRFDAPFTRRVERNNYRSVMIQYQLERRQLYQYQDGVNFTLRSLLRTLNQLQVNLEIQRRAMVIAIRRVDKTREDLDEPPPPVLPGQPVATLGPTVAQNLIFALNDLQTSQNVFMSVVLNHFENRMLLYRELGIMELDECGIWIDKPINEADWLTEEQCPMPPSVPGEWLEEAGVDQQAVRDYAAQHTKDGQLDPWTSLALLPPAAHLETQPQVNKAEANPNPPSGKTNFVSKLFSRRSDEPTLAQPAAAQPTPAPGGGAPAQPLPDAQSRVRPAPGGAMPVVRLSEFVKPDAADAAVQSANWSTGAAGRSTLDAGLAPQGAVRPEENLAAPR
jgi:hypothetical protein